MSTNAALVNSLEWYMDDLVDCFEDFVRKSLLVISVALGTILLMVMYVLKVLAERAASTRNASGIRGPATVQDFQCGGLTTSCREVNTEDQMQSKSDTTLEDDTESTPEQNGTMKGDTVTSNYVLNSDNSTCTSGQLACRPSFDEKVLREIGLSSCSKNPCVLCTNVHFKTSSIPTTTLLKVYSNPYFLLLYVLRRRRQAVINNLKKPQKYGKPKETLL